MALISTGGKIFKDLEAHDALGVYVPLEGGYEGRYRRRIRARGYVALNITARGLGDLATYHLGKKSSSSSGAQVGEVYFLPPIIGTQLDNLPAGSKGLLLWIIEGYILSKQELEFLVTLAKSEPRLKIVVEMGGDRVFRWQPLTMAIAAA
jgi:NAD(P)H-quinone oxidoreductase subunit N